MSFLDGYKNLSGFNMLKSFMNPGQPYEDAAQEAQRAWLEAQGFQKPFQQAGLGQVGNLQTASDQLLHPDQMENQWAQGYETSPYALDALGRSKDIGLDAASSMGLLGSSSALENIQRTGSSIMSGDRRNYLQDLIQKYLAGVQNSQNLFNTGAGVGQNLGQDALRTGENLGQARYGASAAPGEMFGKLLGLGAGAAGTAMGGPMAGYAASKFAQPSNMGGY